MTPLAPDAGTIIGVDVGGTKTTVIEGTREARILQRTERPTAATLPFRETWPALSEAIARTIDRARELGRHPRAISIAVGGPLRAAEGRLLNPPNLPGWHGVGLVEELGRRFSGLPIYVEHDAKAGALAELWFGVGHGRPWLTDMVFLTFGTGLGAGIIADRRLIRGSHEMAGEIWRLPVRAPAAARVDDIGDWENAASGRGIAWIASRFHPSRWPIGTAPHDVVASALSGDPQAGAVVTECGRWLGAGIASLVAILDPQMVVLGSLAVVLGERVLEPARAEVAQRLAGWSSDSCPIVASELGARLGDVQSLVAALGAQADDAS